MAEMESLTRQLNLVFTKLNDELSHLSSGIVFVQIRNNVIGKFGIRHDPFETSHTRPFTAPAGMTAAQRNDFRRMAIQALTHKVGWTHGEIQFEFAVRQGKLRLSITFESNYNMANMLPKFELGGGGAAWDNAKEVEGA
ncbi:O-methyltransferase [Paenibacillus thermotolerans]|uniref:O-methyltransferase n=1 Tax=Paenibacillus thermotolerans TaxID=3027807 RepID=UPI002368EB04|nr:MULTISPECIES: O-methyltransferase [unclassified Paenibacillus]